ncbi:MAG TPA: flagellar basal body rod protein FlgC [Steroidobacteraceae bacterium]|nr:flagellar basal body rod protein FlgC [Steroidobacteraceae bacterium]
MDPFKAAAISAAGMAAQQARVEAATLNIANMNTSVAPGAAGYRPVKAVIHPAHLAFARELSSATNSVTVPAAELVVQSGVATRTAYEPGHPHADANGMVAYPAVDHTQEMLTVMTALRSYEANLAALQVTRTLAAKALEIGS